MIPFFNEGVATPSTPASVGDCHPPTPPGLIPFVGRVVYLKPPPTSPPPKPPQGLPPPNPRHLN